MLEQMKERNFEDDICAWLCTHGGYRPGDPARFDRTRALDVQTLLDFVRTSQPKAWKMHQFKNPGKAEQSFVDRFCEEVRRRSLLDVLRYALERPGIRVCTGQAVTAVKRIAEGFTVRTETEVFAARKVILAAGGAAGSKVGGVMDGYRLAKMLGHHRTVLYPSLVQLRTDPTYPRALKGVKAECGIAILRGGERVAENRGEVLFTEYGVSGPAIFDISRTVSTGGEGLVCALDFFPDWETREVLDWLRLRREAMGAHEASTLLVGSCHTRLGQMLCKAAGFTSQRAADLTDSDLERIARQAKRFALPITGTCGFDQAQVTAGGLRTEEFDPETLESRVVPGLYACGEVLDVDGDCGGFNLQWAWSSGHLAGLLL